MRLKGALMRYLLFSIIGGIGVAVNLLLFKFFSMVLFAPPIAYSILASFGSMLGNFYLNDWLTFRGRQVTTETIFPMLRKLSRYLPISLGGIGLTASLFAVAVSHGVSWLPAQITSIFLTSIFTFFLHNRFTWRDNDDVSAGANTPFGGVQENLSV